MGVPVTLIAEAVFQGVFPRKGTSGCSPQRPSPVRTGKSSATKRNAFRACGTRCMHRRSSAMRRDSCCFAGLRAEYSWDLDFGENCADVARRLYHPQRVPRQDKQAYVANAGLESLLLDGYFRTVLAQCQDGWRKTVAAAAHAGIPVPAISAALAFYDGYRCDRLPANLLQAQRDYFGAHTYERVDRPRGTFFHTDWTGKGGQAASGSYNA